jgi:hypothetical protein
MKTAKGGQIQGRHAIRIMTHYGTSVIPLAAADYEALDFLVPRPECGEPVQECLDRSESALPPRADIWLRRNIGRYGPLSAARTRSKSSKPFRHRTTAKSVTDPPTGA